MDVKEARKLLDEVCADLDRRRAEMSALLGRYARPVGFGLALGLGGIAGCGSGSAPHGVDVYGVADIADLRPPPADAYGVSDLPRNDVVPTVDAYGVADVADLRPPVVDAYAVSDLPRGDVTDAGVVLDSGRDGVAESEAFPGVDTGSVDRAGTDTSKPDAGASVDSEPGDGGAID